MAKLIMGMGLPGAGKSEILKKFSEKYGYEYISVDDVREKFGLTSEQPSTEREWDFIRSQTLENYNENRTVVLDGTFLGDIRKKFLDFARENGIEKIQGLLVETPEEIAWARNLSRERNTSREVFDDRLLNLKNFPPEITDGFDAIFSVDENGELTEAELPNEQIREFKPRQRFL
jgi:predicted kinase